MEKLKSIKKEVMVEILNATTHGIATILSLVGLLFLIMKGIQLDSTQAIVAYAIYGASMIILFLNSTLYHSLSFTQLKSLFQKLDHSAIYLLIAGTYTPYLLIAIKGQLGYIYLTIVWCLALIGIIFELKWTGKFPKLSTFMYLGLGWLGVLMIQPLLNSAGLNAILFLGLGGLSYSIGTIFYSMKHNRWMHIIWHLFVMAGAFFMYISIFLYV